MLNDIVRDNLTNAAIWPRPIQIKICNDAGMTNAFNLVYANEAW
jgi:hypothetical protein